MKYGLFLLFALVSTHIVYSQPLHEDQFLVKPYLQFSTQNGMYILWETKTPATTQVNFGEARFNVSKAVLDVPVTLEKTRLMHEVLLDNLKPETNYFWQVTSVTEKGDTIRSEVYSFKTAVKDSSAYMFALVGDSQRNNTTPWAWGKIAALVWQDRPSFVVHAGDLVDKGLEKKDWLENFFPNGHQLMSRVPLYPVLGNHEQDAPYYYQYIVAPKPEYYYTFKYGNAQFFMIDTNRDVTEGSEQYEWLEWELAKSTATWKIAVHHHPPYSSDNNDHGDAFKALSTLGTKARNLVPLYEQYGLDFCLFGHTHLYERTWPLKENRINMKEGVVYINSGGAGGGLEDFAPTRNWFTLELQSVHHYCTFAIYDKNLVFKAIDHEGKLLDAFQMQKEVEHQSRASVVQPPAPHIITDATLYQIQTNVQLEAAFEGLEIRYTLDGSEPSRSSTLYSKPFILSESAILVARAYTQDGRASRLNKMQFRKMNPQAPINVKKTEKGLRFNYYEGEWQHLPDFSTLSSVKQGTVNQATLSDIGHRDNHFGVVMEGYVEIPATGIHTFFINSDDGSKLYLNDELLIDHDGDHSAISKTGQAILAAGKHKIRIEYFEVSGGQFLQAGLVDPVLGAVPFTPFQLQH
ncbi:MAG: metallophosphoesterase [Saprospiraceae bacterium]|nr:metallophosphoesterase [Saprospiraceae bacterium]